MAAQRSFLRPLRLGAAMAMVCAFCLPLSECSSGNLPYESPGTYYPNTRRYAYKEADVSWWGAAVLLAFSWPMLFVLAERSAVERRYFRRFYFLELILCAGTIYMLWCLTVFEQWLYGAYLVFVSTCVYASTSLVLFARTFDAEQDG
jgi:hypothetical protein